MRLTISALETQTDQQLTIIRYLCRSGRNTRITVTVTAEDRRTRQTYTIMVYRDRSTLSDNANLSALSLDGVSLSPRFSSGTTAYNARVRYDVDRR